MSKRHQSSRRKAYGRRQHELRERPDRHGAWRDTWQEPEDAADRPDVVAFLGLGRPGLHLAIGD